MNAESTSPVGMRTVRAQGRFPSASRYREAPGRSTLREDSTAHSALFANAAP